MSNNARPGSRGPAELRPLKLTPDFVSTADGSVFIELGGTRVLCSAQVVNGVPNWRRGSGSGWLTAEYSLLPSSTRERTPREAVRGRQDGRTVEIQRFIGRSLRAVIDLQGSGRADHLHRLRRRRGRRRHALRGRDRGATWPCTWRSRRAVDARALRTLPLADSVAAVSVGVVGGMPVVDLEYEEDCRAEVDMNVVTTGSGRIIEVQATAEVCALRTCGARPVARSGDRRHRCPHGRADGSRGSGLRGQRRGPPVTHRLTVVLATRNAGKAREFGRLLDEAFEVEPLPDEMEMPEETGSTFRENARLKAEAAFEALGEQRAVLADDSGLEVERSGRSPGRPVGPLRGRDGHAMRQNVAKLLRRTSGCRRPQRPLRLLALPSAASGRPDGRSRRCLRSGENPPGSSRRLPAGDDGFGYDPVFRPLGWAETLAEAAPARKDEVSHRGAAARSLLELLRESPAVPRGH